MRVRNVIHRGDAVKNSNRRFGSSLAFVPVRVVDEDGDESEAFFLQGEITRAEIRARNNPEDWPGRRTREGWFDRLWIWFWSWGQPG